MKYRLILGLCSILIVIFVWQFSRPNPIAVHFSTVEKGNVESIIVNTRAGTVKACQRARLSLAIGGQVEKLYVQNGSKVAAGDTLLELWNLDRKALLQQSQAAYESAHLEHDRSCVTASNNMREAQRHQSLLKKQLVSQGQADSSLSLAKSSEFACKAAKSREEQAQAAVTVATALLQQTILTAPFAGVIAEVTGEVGEFATPSPPGVATPPAIDLMSDNCHYVDAPIDEVDASNLHIGQEVRVHIDAIPQQAIMGNLRRIAPYVQDYEKQARTVSVEVNLLGIEDLTLLAGYSADVEIVLERQSEVLRIPAEALLEDASSTIAKPSYYVLKLSADNTLSRAPVTVGLRNWQVIQVISGLKVGDTIVSSVGLPGVTDGVYVVDAKAIQNQ
jgi:HlyD family secretion protein